MRFRKQRRNLCQYEVDRDYSEMINTHWTFYAENIEHIEDSKEKKKNFWRVTTVKKKIALFLQFLYPVICEIEFSRWFPPSVSSIEEVCYLPFRFEAILSKRKYHQTENQKKVLDSCFKLIKHD